MNNPYHTSAIDFYGNPNYASYPIPRLIEFFADRRRWHYDHDEFHDFDRLSEAEFARTMAQEAMGYLPPDYASEEFLAEGIFN